MNILLINGSPRRERGNTHAVLDAVATALEDSGANTTTLYLADENPEYCTHCGHDCFQDGRCTREDGATRRSEQIQAADALVLGAPVYCWQPNALTCMLFDKFRIPDGTWMASSEPGTPAMGIAVAGGTGTGVFTALQSMYAWLCAWRFRPLEPVPVTRYNQKAVIDRAESLAASLVDGSAPVFSDTWDQMLLYDKVRYMDYRRIDEYRWLAARMLENLDKDSMEFRSMTSSLEAAHKAEVRGDLDERARKVMDAFKTGFAVRR